jgi:hypothetical protein
MAKTYEAPLGQEFETKYATVNTALGSVNTRVWDANCSVIFEAGVEGDKIGELIFKATGQVAACNVVVFISEETGTTFEPIFEEVFAAAGITPSATVKSGILRIPFQMSELLLKGGQKIGFGITANCVTGKIVGWAVRGSY